MYWLSFNFLQSRLLMTVRKKALENIVGKGENAGNQHFLLFLQCFLPFLKQISSFQFHLICCLQMLSIWTSQKFYSLVKSYLNYTKYCFQPSLDCEICFWQIKFNALNALARTLISRSVAVFCQVT